MKDGGDVREPMTPREVRELLSATLHGPLPQKTVYRMMATLAEWMPAEALARPEAAPEEQVKELRVALKICQSFIGDGIDPQSVEYLLRVIERVLARPEAADAQVEVPADKMPGILDSIRASDDPNAAGLLAKLESAMGAEVPAADSVEQRAQNLAPRFCHHEGVHASAGFRQGDCLRCEEIAVTLLVALQAEGERAHDTGYLDCERVMREQLIEDEDG